ncbi:MAG: hypothetical protein GXX90_08465 [Microbacteriaceae bacterium]|nr:hypothetical protein [Microbacteriaceae bacterium]
MIPTLALRYAEAESCWAAWGWTDRDRPEAARLHPRVLPALAQLRPSVLPDAGVDASGAEPIADALARARRGPLGDPAGTARLGEQLADALLPGPVVLALLDRAQQAGRRPRLRIHPSPGLARVPWPLLRVRLTADGSRRAPLLDLADLCLGAPADAVADALPPEPGEGLVAVIDPRVPGFAADSALGSVLGRPHPDDRLVALVDRHRGRLRPAVDAYPELVRRRDLDRDWLRGALAGAARLLYLGHVSVAGAELATGATSSMHLCCVDDAGRHRPLSAAELLADAGMRFPARVALLGCGSGTDLGYPEPMGLALAAVLRGAELVTAASWTLPTDAALEGEPLRRLVLAVDAAHDAADPVAALSAWQLERAEAWAAAGEPADSPLVWAAALTHVR